MSNSLSNTQNDNRLNEFRNIISEIKTICTIPSSIFVNVNGTFTACLQVDYTDEHICQIGAYTAPSGKTKIIINHTCPEYNGNDNCKHIDFALLIYEVYVNRTGGFAQEFMNPYLIPNHPNEYYEMLGRFEDKLNDLIKISTVSRFTPESDPEDMVNITADIIFLTDTPVREIPIILQKKQTKNTTNKSSNLEDFVLDYMLS